MKVILKRVFFAGGRRYRSHGKFPVDMPDRFRNILPKDAVVVEELGDVLPGDGDGTLKNGDPEDEEPYVNPAHEADTERQFAEALSDKNKDAEKEVVKNRRQQLKKAGK